MGLIARSVPSGLKAGENNGIPGHLSGKKLRHVKVGSRELGQHFEAIIPECGIGHAHHRDDANVVRQVGQGDVPRLSPNRALKRRSLVIHH